MVLSTFPSHLDKRRKHCYVLLAYFQSCISLFISERCFQSAVWGMLCFTLTASSQPYHPEQEPRTFFENICNMRWDTCQPFIAIRFVPMANLLQNHMPSWTSRESGSRFRVMVTRKVDVLLVLTNRQGENPRGGFLITPFMRRPLKSKIRAHDYSQRDRKEFTRMYCPKLSQLLEWNQDAICESWWKQHQSGLWSFSSRSLSHDSLHFIPKDSHLYERRGTDDERNLTETWASTECWPWFKKKKNWYKLRLKA